MFHLSEPLNTPPMFRRLRWFCLCAALTVGAPAFSQNAELSIPERDAEALALFKTDLAAMQMLLQTEIAALQKFADWTEYLVNLAESDPHAALSQRLPMAACKSTSLVPDCEKMRALFVQYLGIVPSRHFHLRYFVRQ